MKFLRNSLLGLAFFSAVIAPAKTATGFLVGSSEMGAYATGVYKIDLDNGNALTKVTTLPYSLFGGTYAEHNYWLLLGMDPNGLVMQGFCGVNPETGAVVKQTAQEYCCADMTFDLTTNNIYGILTKKAGTDVDHELIRIALPGGDRKPVAPLDGKFTAIACDMWGNMYVMSSESVLYSIDSSTGKTTQIGSTGFVASESEAQSLEFDRDSGVLYWSALDSEDNSWIMTLDTRTGSITGKYSTPGNALFGALHIPYQEVSYSAPNSIMYLEQTKTADGVNFAWKYPVMCVNGRPLNGSFRLEIRRNGELVHTVSDPEAGAAASWTDSSEGLTGKCRYSFTCYNDEGRGASVYATVWYGADAPAAVTDLSVKASGETAVLSWTAPATGLNGGEIDPEQTRYRITRMPGNKVYDGIAATEFTDNDIPEASNYTWTVTAYNTVGESPAVTSGTVVAGKPLDTPWNPVFSNASDLAKMCIIDVNSDGNTWYQKDGEMWFSSLYYAGDEWLISVPVHLEKDRTYKLKYKLGTGMYSFPSTESVRFTLGTDCTPASQTRVIRDLPAFNAMTEDFEDTVTVEETGDYTFGIYAYSVDGWVIKLMNFAVENVSACDLAATEIVGDTELAVGKAATHAVTVKNMGTESQTGFEVQIVDGQGKVLASKVSDETIAAGATAYMEIEWTPAEGTATGLRAKVVKEGDEVAANDLSPVLAVQFLNSGDLVVAVGIHDSDPGVLPFSFQDIYSFSQSVYTREEIGVNGGLVKEISWSYNNPAGDILGRDIKIFMANTIADEVLRSFTPESELKLVYDGKADFLAGRNVLTVKLDEPFAYTGGSLMVLTEKIGDNTRNVRVTFDSQNYPDIPRTALSYNGTGVVGGSNLQFSSMLPNIRMLMNTENGEVLAGTVTGAGNPLAGVVVTLKDRYTAVRTDSHGVYEFGWLPAGIYEVAAEPSDYRYMGATRTVDVAEGFGDVVDFDLQPRAKAAYSGKVTDSKGNPVPYAGVTLSGWETYTVSTDSEGLFSINDVYEKTDNVLRVVATGYRPANNVVSFVPGTSAPAAVSLEGIHNAPANVKAINENGNVRISWDAVDFAAEEALDNNVPGEPLYLPTYGNYYIAKVFAGAMRLYGFSWLAASDASETDAVAVIYALDEQGNVTSVADTVYDIPCAAGKWNECTLEAPVESLGGFMVAISSLEQISIACDTQKITGSYLIDSRSNAFGALEGRDGPMNLMIRVRASFFNPMFDDVFPEISYTVNRISGDNATNVGATAETEIVDTTWASAPEQTCRYSVVAETADGTSEAAFSEEVGKDSGVSGIGAADIEIAAVDGGIRISAATACAAAIYDITGKTVFAGTVEAGDTRIQLPAGMYIVTAGTTTAKVPVK